MRDYPGAEGKGFPNRPAAEIWLAGNPSEASGKKKKKGAKAQSQPTPKPKAAPPATSPPTPEANNDTQPAAAPAPVSNVPEVYVDGSFRQGNPVVGYGVVIIQNGKIIEQFGRGLIVDEELAKFGSGAGELLGTEAAIDFCLNKGFNHIVLYYDCASIEDWCKSSQKPANRYIEGFREFYNGISSRMRIDFVKVKSHSGNVYNNLADGLAKNGLKNPVRIHPIRSDAHYESKPKSNHRKDEHLFSTVPRMLPDSPITAEMSPEELVRRVEEAIYRDGFLLYPPYKRDNAWDDRQRRLFVERLLAGDRRVVDIYINAPFLRDNTIGNRDYACIDGTQRILALRAFFNNEFAVFGAHYSEYSDKIKVKMVVHLDAADSRNDNVRRYKECNPS